MNKLKILIADDEAPARSKMKRMLELLGVSDEIIMAENGIDALQKIREEGPDLVFLDIEMPGKTGLEVAESLEPDEAPMIIFATAYNEHAVKAFEINAMDYLLKPFNQDRLSMAIQRALKSNEDKTPLSKEQIQSVKEPENQEEGLPFYNKIPVPTRDRYKLIDYDEIVCIEIEERSVRLYTKEKSYILNHPLETFEKRLPPDKFFRVNRSTIINFSQLKEIVIWFGNRFKIIMCNDKEIISSREKTKVLKSVLKI
ncbi:MAG: LytTR family DNA-binding domain-containing protein [Bacteroidia bacterium]|nr:LytTR family DNA-binding domain-containing protein [Bacteroidia bacterium]